MSIFYSPSPTSNNNSNNRQQLNLVITPDLPPDSSLLSSINCDNNTVTATSTNSGETMTNNHDYSSSTTQQQQLATSTSSGGGTPAQRKPFKTEYKSKFTPFDQYVYNEVTDSFVKPSSDLSSNISSSRSNQNLSSLCSPRHETTTITTTNVSTQEAEIFEPSTNFNPTDACREPWYKEVVKRNEKANEYRFKSEIGHNSPLLNYALDQQQQQQQQQQQKSSSNTNIDRLTSPHGNAPLECPNYGNGFNNSNIMDKSSAQHACGESIVPDTTTTTSRQFRFTPNDYKRDHLIAHMANNNNFALPKDQQPETKSNASAAARRAIGTTSSARPATRSAAQVRSRSQSSRRQVTTTSKASNINADNQQQKSTPTAKSQQTTPIRTAKTPVVSSSNTTSRVTPTVRATTSVRTTPRPTTAKATVTPNQTSSTTSATKRTTTTAATATTRTTPRSANGVSAASRVTPSSSASDRRKPTTTPTTARPTTAASSRSTPKASSSASKSNMSAIAPGKLPNGNLRATTPATGSGRATTTSLANKAASNRAPLSSSAKKAATGTTESKSNNNSPLNAVKSVKTPKAMEAAKQAAEIAAVSAAALAAGAILVIDNNNDDNKQQKVIQEKQDLSETPISVNLENEQFVVENKAEEQFIMQPQQYITEDPTTNLIFTTTEGGNMLADELAEAELAAAAKQNIISTDMSSKFYQELGLENASGRQEEVSERLFDEAYNSNDADKQNVKVDERSELFDNLEVGETQQIEHQKLNEVADNQTESHHKALFESNETNYGTEFDTKVLEKSLFEEINTPIQDNDSSSESSYGKNQENIKEEQMLVDKEEVEFNQTSKKPFDENLIMSQSKQDFDMEISENLNSRLNISDENFEEKSIDLQETNNSIQKNDNNETNNNDDADQLINGISGGLVSAEDRFDSSEREMSPNDFMSNDNLAMMKSGDSTAAQLRTYDIDQVDQNPDDEPYSIMPTMSEHKDEGQYEEIERVVTTSDDHDQENQNVGNLLVEEALREQLDKRQESEVSVVNNDDIYTKNDMVKTESFDSKVENKLETTSDPMDVVEEKLVGQNQDQDQDQIVTETTDNEQEREQSEEKKDFAALLELEEKIEPTLAANTADFVALNDDKVDYRYKRSENQDFISEEDMKNISEDRKSIPNSGDDSSSDTDNDADFKRNELLMNVADLMGAESKIKQEMRRKSELARQNSSPQPLGAPQGEILLSPDQLADRVSRDFSTFPDSPSSPSTSTSSSPSPPPPQQTKMSPMTTASEKLDGSCEIEDATRLVTLDQQQSTSTKEELDKGESRIVDSIEEEKEESKEELISTTDEMQKNNVKLSSTDMNVGDNLILKREKTNSISSSSASSSEENLAKVEKEKDILNLSSPQTAKLDASEMEKEMAFSSSQVLEPHQHLFNNNDDRESDDNEMMNTHTSNTNQSNDDDDMDNDEQLKLSNHLTNSEDELILEPRNFNYSSSSGPMKEQKLQDVDEDSSKDIYSFNTTRQQQQQQQLDIHTNDNASLNLMTMDLDGISESAVEIGDGRSAAIETGPTLAEERVEMSSKSAQALINNKIVPEISHSNYMFSRTLTDDSDSEAMMVGSATKVDQTAIGNNMTITTTDNKTSNNVTD